MIKGHKAYSSGESRKRQQSSSGGASAVSDDDFKSAREDPPESTEAGGEPQSPEPRLDVQETKVEKLQQDYNLDEFTITHKSSKATKKCIFTLA